MGLKYYNEYHTKLKAVFLELLNLFCMKLKPTNRTYLFTFKKFIYVYAYAYSQNTTCLVIKSY